MHLRDLGTSLFLPYGCCVAKSVSAPDTQDMLPSFAPSGLRVEDEVSPNSKAPLPLLLPKICCTDFEKKIWPGLTSFLKDDLHRNKCGFAKGGHLN